MVQGTYSHRSHWSIESPQESSGKAVKDRGAGFLWDCQRGDGGPWQSWIWKFEAKHSGFDCSTSTKGNYLVNRNRFQESQQSSWRRFDFFQDERDQSIRIEERMHYWIIWQQSSKNCLGVHSSNCCDGRCRRHREWVRSCSPHSYHQSAVQNYRDH